MDNESHWKLWNCYLIYLNFSRKSCWCLEIHFINFQVEPPALTMVSLCSYPPSSFLREQVCTRVQLHEPWNSNACPSNVVYWDPSTEQCATLGFGWQPWTPLISLHSSSSPQETLRQVMYPPAWHKQLCLHVDAACPARRYSPWLKQPQFSGKTQRLPLWGKPASQRQFSPVFGCISMVLFCQPRQNSCCNWYWRDRTGL